MRGMLQPVGREVSALGLQDGVTDVFVMKP